MAKIKAGNYVLYNEEVWKVVCRHRSKALRIKELDWIGMEILIFPKNLTRITKEVADIARGV